MKINKMSYLILVTFLLISASFIYLYFRYFKYQHDCDVNDILFSEQKFIKENKILLKNEYNKIIMFSESDNFGDGVTEKHITLSAYKKSKGIYTIEDLTQKTPIFTIFITEGHCRDPAYTKYADPT